MRGHTFFTATSSAITASSGSSCKHSLLFALYWLCRPSSLWVTSWKPAAGLLG